MNRSKAWSAGLAALAVGLWVASAFAGNTTYREVSNNVLSMSNGANYPLCVFQANSPELPGRGKPRLTPYDGGGVWADFLAKDLTFTDPVTGETFPYDFTNWLTITPAYHLFAAGQMWGPEVTASLSVPYGAPVGTYGGKLVARGPEGIGWGEGSGVHFTFNIVPATAIDTTPPVVSVTAPSEGAAFTLGHRVEAAFTAIDQESAVSGWTAALNPGTAYETDVTSLFTATSLADGIEASGTILTALDLAGNTATIKKIGSYALVASATSDGGTDSASRGFSVNYDLDPIAPHLTASALICDKSEEKCNGAARGDLQIKFKVSAVNPPDTDTLVSSDEVFVRDETVRVKVLSADGTEVLNRAYGTNSSSSVTIGGVTGEATGDYLTKMAWLGLANGTYTIFVYFGDYAGVAFLQYSKSFTIQD